MLDINFIRNNPEEIKKNNEIRGCKVDVDEILKLDEQRRKLIEIVDAKRGDRNKVSGNEGKPSAEDIARMKELKEGLKKEESELNKVEESLHSLLIQLPNLTHESVPQGKSEDDNTVVKQVGKIPKFDFKPKEHWELGKDLDVIDSERAAQVSGARFTYLKGELAYLQFALINHVLKTVGDTKVLQEIIDKNKLDISAAPFIPVIPPVFVKPEIMEKMGRLEPKDERYYIKSDDQYLIGSAEHTLGPMHMKESFPEDQLPIRYIGYSTAFRREAGSYGKDTKGILRMHQFDKLEMETFCLPEDSIIEQDFIVAIQEYLVESLELPYQRVAICTADMGDPDYRQIDLEVWMPGQNTYRETHTADLMTDYQSRRLNIKVKRKKGDSELVHMNDATAFALGRIMIGIMENYQTKEGTIRIPKVLLPFMFGIKEIKR